MCICAIYALINISNNIFNICRWNEHFHIKDEEVDNYLFTPNPTFMKAGY